MLPQDKEHPHIKKFSIWYKGLLIIVSSIKTQISSSERPLSFRNSKQVGTQLTAQTKDGDFKFVNSAFGSDQFHWNQRSV